MARAEGGPAGPASQQQHTVGAQPRGAPDMPAPGLQSPRATAWGISPRELNTQPCQQHPCQHARALALQPSQLLMVQGC